MNIQLAWDQSQLDQFIGQVPRRLAYATVNAINLTAVRIQQAEFARARSLFTIRKEAFFFGTTDRPGGAAARLRKASVSKGVPFAELTAGTLPNGGDATGNRRLLYSKFEAGGMRTPFVGKNVAEPVLQGPARPSKSDPINPAFTFQRLGFKAFYKASKGVGRVRLTHLPGSAARARLAAEGNALPDDVLGLAGRGPGRTAISRDSKGITWRGREGTYISFSERFPHGAVFQRTGVGKKAGRLVWVFDPPFQLERNLEFVGTAQAVAATYFAEECAKQVQLMLDHDNEKFVLQALREL